MTKVSVTIDEKRKVLILELPLISPLKPSSTGRTLLVATTKGNVETDIVVNDEKVYVGANAYIYATKKGTEGQMEAKGKGKGKAEGEAGE